MPTNEDLQTALGASYGLWHSLAEFAREVYPKAGEEWNFSSAKFGWSFRIKDKKRVLLYLLPRDGFFKVALVFGQKATDAIMESGIAESIKAELQHAPVYAEGRGIRLSITDNSLVEDLKELVRIKTAH